MVETLICLQIFTWDKIPLLPGALDCANAGIFSSLQSTNKSLKHIIENYSESVGRSCFPLIFDPQTSGGLLISIPYEKSQELLNLYNVKGCAPHATVIGKFKKSLDKSLVHIV